MAIVECLETKKRLYCGSMERELHVSFYMYTFMYMHVSTLILGTKFFLAA